MDYDLPNNANKIIPKVDKDAKSIEAIVKEGNYITGYKLSGGAIVSKEEGISLAKNGKIAGVGIASNKGSEYLRSLADNQDSNNLSNLPIISM